MTRPRPLRAFLHPARATRALPCVLLFVALAFPASSAVLAGEQPRLGILGDVRVDKGEVYHDDLVCIGGNATVAGKVEGDVVVIGGKLDFSGEAENVVVVGGKLESSGKTGDLVAVASKARILSGSVINGDLVHVMGDLHKDPDVKVGGQSVDVGSHLPVNVRRLLSGGLLGLVVLLRILSLVFSLVLLLILVLLVPERIERMSDSLEPRWPASLGFGVLAFVVSTGLTIFLAITIIGIPLAALLWLAVYILELMGIAGILALLGKRVGLGTGLIGPEAGVLSCVLVGFCVVALVRFVPVIGDLAWWALSVLGLGLTLVTKLGSPSTVETAP